MSSTTAPCPHLTHPGNARPKSTGCDECIEIGDRWVHLRACLQCGHVGCCDSSKNKHATAHFRSTRHPVIRSLEPGERWLWCYADELAVE
jgi:uncharacterized UBP type Zn finger protein